MVSIMQAYKSAKYETNLVLNMEVAGAIRSITILVRYDLSAAARDAAEERHAGYLTEENIRHAANIREGAGHVGADRLGNQMLEEGRSMDQRAQERAMELLGVTQRFRRARSTEEAEAFFARQWPASIDVEI